MGFFDTYTDSSDASFIGADEKAELVAAGTPLPVLRVSEGKTQFGEKFFVRVLLDGEERVISFGKVERNADGELVGVESRDNMLTAMKEYLADETAERPMVKIVKKGRSFLLKDVNAE